MILHSIMESPAVSESNNKLERQVTLEEKEEVSSEQIDEPIVSSLIDDEVEDDEDEDDEQEGGESDEDMDNKVHIDLSDNDYYKGLCTLLEDEHGNNILEYISLLHTELIGVNKNLRLVRKEMNRMANCAEIMVKKGN